MIFFFDALQETELSILLYETELPIQFLRVCIHISIIDQMPDLHTNSK